MLSAKEKLTFGVLTALFVVPEIIWGIISKYWFFSSFGSWKDEVQHIPFLSDPTNGIFYTNILFVQAIGLLMSVIFIVAKRKSIKLYIPMLAVLFLLVCFSPQCCSIRIQSHMSSFIWQYDLSQR